MVMRAVGMVLRAQLRQHGKSWLALAVLAAALAVANLLAVLPALHAARSRPADLLRAE